LLFVSADAVGECVEGGVQQRDLVVDAGEGSAAVGAASVVVDNGAQRGVAVEGGAAQAGDGGDGGEGDRLAVAAQLGACSVRSREGAGAAHPAPLPDGHVDVVISNCVINLSADKPRVLAEAFRVLRPGGRLGISDVIADEGLDPAQRIEAEQRTGCATGTLTAAEYRTLLLASGFTSTYITATQEAEPGLRSASIQATRPGRTSGDPHPVHAD
jgi:SAM-dependent methyltransferase